MTTDGCAPVEAAGAVAGGTEILGAAEELGDAEGVTDAEGLRVVEGETEGLGEDAAEEPPAAGRATGFPPPPQAVRASRHATVSATERRACCDRELAR